MKKLTVTQMLKIHGLSEAGYSSRSIAKMVLGSESKKSTVNDFLKRDKVIVPPAPEYNPDSVAIKKKAPRIAYYDLECAPSVAVTFGRFKQNIGVDNVLDEGGWLISAVVKTDDNIISLCLTQEEVKAKDDKRLIAQLWEIFEQVDIAVAQNGDRFDWALFKTRCIKNGFPVPKTIKHIDTLKIAKQLKFNSNRLDSLGKELGLGRKIQHSGIDLWIRCMNGDQTALDEMLEYNVQDVVLLEQVYKRLRSFDSKHPNVSHFYDDENARCPVCGSSDVHETGNSVFTPISEFAELVCNDCGHRSRSRKNLNSKEKRSNILITPKLTG